MRNEWLGYVDILEATLNVLSYNGTCVIGTLDFPFTMLEKIETIPMTFGKKRFINFPECLYDDAKKEIISNCSKWYDGMTVTSQRVLAATKYMEQFQKDCS